MHNLFDTIIEDEILDSQNTNGSNSFNKKELLDSTHKRECMEVLDNLGYLQIDQNDCDSTVSEETLKEAIYQFRRELNSCTQLVNDYPTIQGKEEADGLSETELDYFEDFCSLEGDFNLHQFSLETISKDCLLCRILLYRFWMYNLEITNAAPSKPTNFEIIKANALELLQLNNDKELIEALGDTKIMAKHIDDICVNTKDPYDAFLFANFKRKNVKVALVNAYPNLKFPDIKPNKRDYAALIKNATAQMSKQIVNLENEFKRNSIKKTVERPFNQFKARLLQIKMAHLGTYEGKIDGDIGDVTITSVINLIEYINFNSGNSNHKLEDVCCHLIKHCYAINTNYLFRKIFELDKDDKTVTEEEIKDTTISQHLIAGYNSINLDEKEEEIKQKKAYLEELENQVITHTKKTCKSRKNRAGKILLRTIGRFFRKVGEWIKKGIKKIKEYISSFFTMIANGVQFLLREIKKIYTLLKQGLSFFFSKRIIETKTENNKTAITSDYDGSFDVITKVYHSDEACLDQHIQSLNEHSNALLYSAGFLGKAIKIIRNLITGPVGWIHIGLELIKLFTHQAKEKSTELIFNGADSVPQRQLAFE